MIPSVFKYTDYRTYLIDWLEWKKKTIPAFSYTIFAQKAGFKDRGFLHNVIHGKRDLTKESLVKVSQAIGHEKDEAEYFENLVFFNKSTDLKNKTYFFEKLNSVKGTDHSAAKAQEIRKDQLHSTHNGIIALFDHLLTCFHLKIITAGLPEMSFPPSHQAKQKNQYNFSKNLVSLS